MPSTQTTAKASIVGFGVACRVAARHFPSLEKRVIRSKFQAGIDRKVGLFSYIFQNGRGNSSGFWTGKRPEGRLGFGPGSEGGQRMGKKAILGEIRSSSLSSTPLS